MRTFKSEKDAVAWIKGELDGEYEWEIIPEAVVVGVVYEDGVREEIVFISKDKEEEARIGADYVVHWGVREGVIAVAVETPADDDDGYWHVRVFNCPEDEQREQARFWRDAARDCELEYKIEGV
jgi:hypothetical protein